MIYLIEVRIKNPITNKNFQSILKAFRIIFGRENVSSCKLFSQIIEM
jgi:hypothetical protein